MPIRTFLLFLLLVNGKLFAQTGEKFTAALMQTKFGAKMVFTSDSHSVILDIVSKKVEPTKSENVLNVDNKPLQLVLLPNSALSKTDTTLERQKAELLGYADYETKYVKNDVKLAISNITQKWVTINGKLFLFWAYDMPPDNKSVLQQINLSTLCFAHVLNLKNPVTPGETAETNSPLLMDVAKTLRLNNLKPTLIKYTKSYRPKWANNSLITNSCTANSAGFFRRTIGCEIKGLNLLCNK